MLAKRLENLHPYVPGEQPKDRIYIKLNANENPYPPSPEVPKAIIGKVRDEPGKIGLYPDPDANTLREAIAAMLNKTGGVLSRTNVGEKGPDGPTCTPDAGDELGFTVTPDMIFCGNGSDEVLSFVFYTFFDSDRPVVTPEFSYSFYPVYAGFYGIPLDKVALNSNWTLDTKTMAARAVHNDSCTILANPNAPTSLGLTREQVREMIKAAPKDRVFVVDEAYVDFGGESCLPLLAEFKNLVIVRTFSKSMCAAGMRLGYIVADPELTQAVFTVKNSFNHFPVDVIAQTAGVASCRDTPYYVDCAKKIAAERDSFIAFLRKNGWEANDSQTNFIFAKKPGMAGEDIYRAIKADGILVRHFATPGIEDYVRITVGTAAQMTALRASIEKLR